MHRHLEGNVSMRAEIKACVITNLSMHLDQFMSENGFRRTHRSLRYTRDFQRSIQSVDIVIQIHPKDNSNAAAAVYPFMEVKVPTADKVREEMIGENLGLLEGVTNGLSRQPIEFIAEKKEKARWFVFQPDSVREIIIALKSFLERITIPLLDTYATPEQILECHQRPDGRIVVDRAQLMRVISAALVCDQISYAQSLMEDKLGTVGARKRYQQVFDYISRYQRKT